MTRSRQVREGDYCLSNHAFISKETSVVFYRTFQSYSMIVSAANTCSSDCEKGGDGASSVLGSQKCRSESWLLLDRPRDLSEGAENPKNVRMTFDIAKCSYAVMAFISGSQT